MFAFALLAFHPVTVRAAGSIAFEQRDYTVQIQANGDVSVTEHWEVHFSGASYHHAFLQIYTAHTTGIDFGPVAGALPNTQQVTPVNDAAGNALQQVAWDFPPTQDALQTFDIPYIIHSALGVASDQAWFDWHYLDGTSASDFPVAATTVTLHLPQGATPDQVHVDASTADQNPTVQANDGTTVQLTDQNLNARHALEVSVAFPRTLLDATVPRPAWQQEDVPPQLPTPLGVSTPITPTTSEVPVDNAEQTYQPASGPSGEFLNCLVGIILSGAIALLAFVFSRGRSMGYRTDAQRHPLSDPGAWQRGFMTRSPSR